MDIKTLIKQDWTEATSNPKSTAIRKNFKGKTGKGVWEVQKL